MDIQPFLERTAEWFVTSGVQVFLIFILMFIGLQAIRLFSTQLAKRFSREGTDEDLKKRADTLSGIIHQALNIAIVLVGIIMILAEVGIQIGPILAAAGVIGLAIGFGAQKLVEDVISGSFILLEDQIRVGDVVSIADKGGLVEQVNLRMVVLRDLAGNVHYIRNGIIGVVTNMTKDYSRYVFDVGVAYRENVEEVIEVLKEIDEEMRNDPAFKHDILEPLEILGLDKFGDSAVIIKARTKTRPIKQWSVGREFNLRMKKRFDEKDIEIPFPHTTLYIGKEKDGTSPPLHVNVNGAEKRLSPASDR